MVNFGYIYRTRGEYEEGKKWFENSLKIGQELNDAYVQFRASHALGNIHASLKRHEEAIIFYQQAYEWALQTDRSYEAAKPLTSLGVLNYELQRYEKAIKYNEEARLIYRKKEDRINEARITINTSAIYLEQNKTQLALEKIQEAIEMINLQETPDLVALCHINLADGYYRLKDYKKALSATDEALAIYKKYLLSEHSNIILYERSKAFKGLKQYKA